MHKIRKNFAVAAAAVCCACVFSGCENTEYTNVVKHAAPQGINTSYEEAFDNFFLNPKWEYFEADTGADVVEFTGTCQLRGSDAKLAVQFLLDKNNKGVFEVGSMRIDGEDISLEDEALYLEDIFEEYMK